MEEFLQKNLSKTQETEICQKTLEPIPFVKARCDDDHDDDGDDDDDSSFSEYCS